MIWMIESQLRVNMSKTSLKTTVEWNLMNWRKLERKVYKLQKRIYRASGRGDVKALRSTRLGNNPEMPKTVTTLLKKQKGKCTHCGLFFRENDVMEVDHKIPKSQGGKDSYDNWQLLHKHCHDTKTANDGSNGIKSGCNSAKPKPTRKLERVEDKWVMRYA
jgi:hypothetical protein